MAPSAAGPLEVGLVGGQDPGGLGHQQVGGDAQGVVAHRRRRGGHLAGGRADQGRLGVEAVGGHRPRLPGTGGPAARPGPARQRLGVPAASHPRAARYLADIVVTADPAGTVLRPGALDTDGDRITWVGPAGAAPPAPGPVTDLGGLLMPGFVNTHAHTPMTLLRGSGDGLPLTEWLHDAIWPREGLLTGDDVHWGMLLGCDEMLRAG